MIKLTQRAWNNVIIISTLILILLFNFSSNFLNNGAEQDPDRLTLIPTDLIITTIEFEHQTVERIGQGWRAHSALYSNQDLAQLVQNWQQAEVKRFDQAVQWLPANSQRVSLWFAAQASPIDYQFLTLADKTLVQIDNQIYQLVSPDLASLILAE